MDQSNKTDLTKPTLTNLPASPKPPNPPTNLPTPTPTPTQAPSAKPDPGANPLSTNQPQVNPLPKPNTDFNKLQTPQVPLTPNKLPQQEPNTPDIKEKSTNQTTPAGLVSTPNSPSLTTPTTPKLPTSTPAGTPVGGLPQSSSTPISQPKTTTSTNPLPAPPSPTTPPPNPPSLDFKPVEENKSPAYTPTPPVLQTPPPPATALSVNPSTNPTITSQATPPQPEQAPTFTPPPPQAVSTPPPSNPNMSSPPPSNPVNTTPPLDQQSGSKKSPMMKILAIIIGLVLVVLGLALGFAFLSGGSIPGLSSLPFFLTTRDGSGTNKPTEDVVLEYWGLWEPGSVIDSVLRDFETQNPGVKVNYSQQSSKDYRERLAVSLSSGKGPDVFRFHNTWVPMFVQQLAPAPASIISQAQFQSTFYPVASSDLIRSGSVLGVPLMIDGLGLYYNKDMFQAASITSPPDMWEDFVTIAQTLTITTNNRIERGGAALGLTSNVDNFSDIIGLMMLQSNSNPAKPNDPQGLAQEALLFYQSFVDRHKVWDASLPASTTAFADGKVAMIIAPSWRALEINERSPNLNFAIAPVPKLPNSDVSWASYWAEGVSASSPNQQLAWKLLVYLSEADTLRKLYTSASSQRLFGEPFSRVDLASQLIGDPYVGAYIQQAPYAKSFPLASRTFDNGLNDGLIKYFEDALNAGINEESLETVTLGVEQVFGRYGLSVR